jgi:hypothetical protein
VDRERELHDQAWYMILSAQSFRSRQENEDAHEIHGGDRKEVENTVTPYHGREVCGGFFSIIFVGFTC